ncbi:MAG: MotA/TolQ/ExbB proton channel family protein [Gammaproteobacteria bacterium]|nr:MotA/TolQ/ExbB proton channel family protein [Gammaproteobacteria bacterium]
MSFLDSFLQFMDKGGPVMWVIFVTAWVALVMLLERALRVQKWYQRALYDQACFESTRDYRPGVTAGHQSSPVAVLIDRLQWHEIKSEDDIAKQLSIQLSEIMPRLEGSLPTIAIIGGLLPMLGLLGTVTGMISVFEVIALNGTGDPQEMAHGISQALLTTASGLIIAIPVIFSHHLLVRRLRLVLTITEQSMHVVYAQGVKGVHVEEAQHDTQ